ncbi:hypothetical protein GUITHDRAFT_134521 [Guillardia theta CCMP2712]|uniref:Uncharacterized protein n=1 Tax=Guillardia theta (strain CCMP2712) TaxID=905079 RepID=L1JTV0_GUITC|nr:hypothetical protein GUITHDRAFT_134521 [Guillardia theta CCMP2712]EKX51630.1 hypothetical protein GUITHDRAFT_134521 [Guillardia theta CCMP2712]|eukprot:XP_005838610.1 hypothetical protein GUITHDRAFT_134521 [Guillardia theta CCMP2712]
MVTSDFPARRLLEQLSFSCIILQDGHAFILSNPCRIRTLMKGGRRSPLVASAAPPGSAEKGTEEQSDNAKRSEHEYQGQGHETRDNPLNKDMFKDFFKQNSFVSRWMEDEIQELESSIGYDVPGQGQIVEYDPAFLSKLGWMINLRGTVFSIPFIYWQFLWLLVVAGLYAWAAGPMPAVIDAMGIQGISCSTGGPRLKLPILKPQTFALSLVGGLLGFLLSLFNANGLDRWWKTRDCLGIVIGRSVDISMMISIYIKGWDAESERVAAWYRAQLIRWCNLAHILIYRQANNQDDLTELIEDTNYNPPRQWLTREELVLFEPSKAQESSPVRVSDSLTRRRKFFSQQLAARPRTKIRQDLKSFDPPLVSRYVVVYYWMDELISKAAREGLIDSARPEALWKLQDNITKMRGAAADVFMYLYCKIPYISVGGSALKVAWMASRPIDFMLAMLMIFFINLTYEGLLHIHIRVWNPLGFDRNDFPQRRYLDFVWTATHQFLLPMKRLLPTFMIPNAGVFAKPKGLTRMPLPNMAHPPPSNPQHAPNPPEAQPEHAAEPHFSSSRVKDPSAQPAGRTGQGYSGWVAEEGGARQDAPMPPAQVEQVERGRPKAQGQSERETDMLQQARDVKKNPEVSGSVLRETSQLGPPKDVDKIPGAFEDKS